MISNSICPVVTLENIKLYREGNEVLDNISLKLFPGEIHAIVGDHDSGKSYISDILSGVHQPSSGFLYINQERCDSYSITKAQDCGIQTIHQDTHLIDNFTIAENIFTPSINGFNIKKNRMVLEALKILNNYNIDINPSRLFKDLLLSEKIVINIIRALIRLPKLIILDESLDKLSLTDLQKVSLILHKHVSNGLALLCLSHKIDDIYNFAHVVSILRNGKIFITDAVNNIDRLNLIKLCYYQINNEEDISNTSKEFYQLLKYNEAILQKLPTNLIVTDDNNNIKLINETGKKFFCIENKNLRGEKLDVLFTKKNKILLNYIEKAFIERKETSQYHIPLYLSGISKIVNFKTFPIYDGSFLIGNIIIIEDISEQEKLREQINLSEKLASVGLLAAGVAHEINNPLEIIYNHLNYLNLGTKDPECQIIINEIEEELRDIKAIVSNLISFSDNNNASIEVYNLNDLILSLINLIRFNAQHKQIKIDFISDADEIIVKTSRNEMKQVLLNLIKNSFEAMPKGGSIQIKTTFDTEYGETRALIIIDDTGYGIDEKYSKDIFLPFFSTKKKTEHNMGLGLSVIYGIIKKYNGEITASNISSGGTRFKITIPCL